MAMLGPFSDTAKLEESMAVAHQGSHADHRQTSGGPWKSRNLSASLSCCDNRYQSVPPALWSGDSGIFRISRQNTPNLACIKDQTVDVLRVRRKTACSKFTIPTVPTDNNRLYCTDPSFTQYHKLYICMRRSEAHVRPMNSKRIAAEAAWRFDQVTSKWSTKCAVNPAPHFPLPEHTDQSWVMITLLLLGLQGANILDHESANRRHPNASEGIRGCY